MRVLCARVGVGITHAYWVRGTPLESEKPHAGNDCGILPFTKRRVGHLAVGKLALAALGV